MNVLMCCIEEDKTGGESQHQIVTHNSIGYSQTNGRESEAVRGDDRGSKINDTSTKNTGKTIPKGVYTIYNIYKKLYNNFDMTK